ncbi:MAG: hypothetical protein IPH94_15945 [Saprospiraceae bacterium]|nr:hypothetical protein [Saprospiraceae bacterium]MBK7222741.1 hypothetical protein [Saprospiraceae bacterium]MBK7788411.1 hypothetical protein [Saprospiraceae bacterium]MBK8851627.1 hypothetical protein [Saprospiraceae bacterium]MBK9686274.1 hypothetical protein [Saprospiraceae bacterium]
MNRIKIKVINYFETKLKDLSIESIKLNSEFISLVDESRNKISIHIYLNESENRISCLIDDLEIVDEYDYDIDDVLKYIDFIISNEIVMHEVYCKNILVKRYYEFLQKIDGNLQKLKLYSVNKFVLFGDKKKVLFKFKPW